MLIDTKIFGELEVDEEQIITFKEGLPGFADFHKYVLLVTESDSSPFKWLQSVENSELAFAIVNPFAIVKDYDFELSEEVTMRLDIKEVEDILVYAVVVIPEDTTKATVNLIAPIIINTKLKIAEQVVLDTDTYSVRHYILDELRRQEVPKDVDINKEERSVCYSK